MENRTLKLDQETAQGLAYNDYDADSFNVVSNKITGKGRWSTHHELVIQTIPNLKFWKANYSMGATEKQDERPFEYDEAIFTEVFPKTIEVIIYE